MCTKPPRAILFRQLRSRKASFDTLDDDIVPILPIERSVPIKSYSVRRRQVPLCAAFAITDYKAQGQTFTDGILDLKNDSRTKSWDSHRRFCSINVQLSRFTRLRGLNLLRKIQLSDITCQPHSDLNVKIAWLRKRNHSTLDPGPLIICSFRWQVATSISIIIHHWSFLQAWSFCLLLFYRVLYYKLW